MGRRDRNRRRWWAFAIGLSVVAIAAVRVAIGGHPALGLSFLSVLPIALAAAWFGRTGGLLTAGAALALLVVPEAIAASPEIRGGLFVPGVAMRALIFFGTAVGVAGFAARQRATADALRALDGRVRAPYTSTKWLINR